MAVDADPARDELTEQASQADKDQETDRDSQQQKATPQVNGVRGALVVGILMLTSIGGLAGWLGWQTHGSEQAQRLDDMFLQAGRQGALNLTTMDHAHVEGDIQRVLDGSIGTFYDDFEQRAPAFAEVVKTTQSKTQGTVTEAGIESISGDSARVLVAVSVKTSNIAAPEQRPRLWRMRIDVQKVGDVAKVANVGFVA
ncbi:mammalian cell entry protein [Mycolicibacterium porcinum]|uniref:mammalian cell entry protein n=1 Tax=Mycolicibacterium porcinum TaxID=39693 RepID=UPI0008493C27|nr:mammalian cell entry protein [Mycolicibacterium porcinum]ODR26186.1 mammalian cell entry protein [Mycolicibacterium porcinum]